MYVAVTGRKGYEQVEVKESVRIPGGGKKQYTVERHGSLKSLLEKDPDYVEKLRARLESERKAKKDENKKETMAVYPREINKVDDQRPGFAFGHMIVRKLWTMMKLDEFFDRNVTSRSKEEVINVVYVLLSSRLGNPASILKTSVRHKGQAGIQ